MAGVYCHVVVKPLLFKLLKRLNYLQKLFAVNNKWAKKIFYFI